MATNSASASRSSGAATSAAIIGIGGAMPERQVFRYRPSNKQDNRDSLGELPTFVASAGVLSVLLVDDVNVILEVNLPLSAVLPCRPSKQQIFEGLRRCPRPNLVNT